MPAVPKCSAGYFAAPQMDLIDLFVGAEGTLGVIVDATLRVLATRPAIAFVLAPVASEASGLALVGDLRERARATWASGDPQGIDIAAVEHLDRRCLELLREDGTDRRLGIALPDGAALALLIQVELAPGTSERDAFDEIAAAGEGRAPATRLGRFCERLSRARRVRRRRDRAARVIQAAPRRCWRFERRRRSPSTSASARRDGRSIRGSTRPRRT